MRTIRIAGLVCVILAFIATGRTNGQTSLPAVGYVDDSAFRDGLRQRGLNAWLEQYLADTPSPNAIDGELRRREKLLADAEASTISSRQRQALIEQAGAMLAKLVADHPNHPAQLQWRFELARDVLERRGAVAFDALLLYALPGRDRVVASKLSGEALDVLHALRRQIASAWKSLESVDEKSLEELTAAGVLRGLERMDARSAMLLEWARLYHALSGEMADGARKEEFASIVDEVTQLYGWTQLPAGREVQRCNALLMAAIAARGAGRYADADRYVHDMMGAMQKVSNPADRERLKTVALVGVLEQIRILADNGKTADAMTAIEQARVWIAQRRANDVHASLALAFVENAVLGKRTGVAATSQPSVHQNILEPPEALGPFKVIAERSSADRDHLYAAIAGAVEQVPPTALHESFSLQLLAGAAVMDAVSNPTPPAERLAGVMVAIQNALSNLDQQNGMRGELMFLLGRGEALLGRRGEAIPVFGDLVEQFPKHERSAIAAELAAGIAQEWLASPDGANSASARKAFIRAGRLLNQRLPDTAAAVRWRYFIALALEQEGQLEAAAAEYASVPGDDPNRLKALFGRARCLRNMLSVPTATQPANGEAVQRVLQAAREAADFAQKDSAISAAQDRCLAANVVLLLANLLNHPAIHQHAEAVTALANFEKRFADCRAAIGPALRERILALRQLNQLGEARLVIEQFLKTDPESAGPVMAKLLEAMHDEINAASDRGDADAMKNVAGEAAQLAQSLMDWAKQHAGRMSASELATIQVWRAWSLLDSGAASDAMSLFEICDKTGVEVISANSDLRVQIRLGRAECLLALNKPAEALPIFANVWQHTPERSPHWWRAFVGSLECHTRLEHDRQEIVQSIQQQRHLSPDLGGPRWKRALDQIEQEKK